MPALTHTLPHFLQLVNILVHDRKTRADRLASSGVLEKVVEYLIYWYRYQDKDDVPDMDIPVHMCLELLTAADYLGLDSKSPEPVSSTAKPKGRSLA